MENIPTTPITGGITHEDAGVEFIEVSKGFRFLHSIIDTILIYVLIVLNGIMLVLFNIITTEDSFIWNILGYIIFFIYYFLFEAATGKTPVKFITKTVVVNYDNEKPETITIVWRTLSRLIPFDGLSFLGVSGWHDKFSKTKVVKRVTKPNNL